jgi:hypothetical protein
LDRTRATESSWRISLPNRLAAALSRGIAGLASERVVDQAEAVQVHQDERHRFAVARSPAELVRQSVEEQSAVRQTRQGIGVSEEFDPLLLRDEGERERDVAGRFLQELHLLVVEEARFGAVEHQRADHLAVPGKGQGDDGAVPQAQVGAIEAVHPRHQHVADDQIRPLATHEVQGFGTFVRLQHPVGGIAEERDQEVTVDRPVVDHQDPCHFQLEPPLFPQRHLSTASSRTCAATGPEARQAAPAVIPEQ